MYKNCYQILKTGGKIFSTGFLTSTTGYGTGEKVEDNTFQNIETGCLAGRGKAHFWREGEVGQIFEELGFRDIIEEKMIYTDRGNIVAQCIVQGLK